MELTFRSYLSFAESLKSAATCPGKFASTLLLIRDAICFLLIFDGYQTFVGLTTREKIVMGTIIREDESTMGLLYILGIKNGNGAKKKILQK